MLYENQILLGECLPILRQIPDEVLDACASDVPYGLGKDPTIEEIIAYLQGADLVTGDFMGKDWDIPSVPTWKEVYRVLKPGGYVVVFAGTRTFDLISMGLRAAGFECRDTIADNFPDVELPILEWVYATGMPKSHNVSKGIDKKFGKTREVVGVYRTPEGNQELKTYHNWQDKHLKEGTQERRQPLLTAPASEEAAQWDGWGTGLKPSWEPILIFRKPFKGNLADNVLLHGTGALNIDATRVKHASKADFEEHKKQVEAVKAKGGVRGASWKNASDLSGANDVKVEGRWPANLILEHASGCQKVDGDSEVWECIPGCPVAELDAQSGDRPSTLTGRADPNTSHAHPGTEFNPNSTFLGERTHHSNVYADSGGASRFFQQFDGVPFKYIPKANRREAGGGEFEVKHPTLKPIKLMQYLIKLVVAKGGIVLDPYCGSGSTCHAALLEGVRYVGIERDKESWEEATRRMKIIHEQEAERLQGVALHALATAGSDGEESEVW